MSVVNLLSFSPQAELLESYSPIRSLQVGSPPFGEIVYFRVPAAARSGEPVGTSTMIKNTGDLHGSFYITLWDAETGDKLFQSGKVGIGPGAQADFSFTGADGPTMPNRALELLVQSHHDGGYDDLEQKRIPLLVAIATALSLSLNPELVSPGGTYTYSGKLTRTDTGGGVGGQGIILERYEAATWVMKKSVTTDEAGNYNGSVVAPTELGQYDCRTRYLGIIILGPSFSKTLKVQSGVLNKGLTSLCNLLLY